MEELKSCQRHAVRLTAMRIQGKLNFILKAETNGVTVQRLRELCNDIYVRTDELVELLDKVEKENEGIRCWKDYGAEPEENAQEV